MGISCLVFVILIRGDGDPIVGNNGRNALKPDCKMALFVNRMLEILLICLFEF